MEHIKKDMKNGIAYLLYLAIFFILGYLVSDHLNINDTGLQEVLNTLKNLDITSIACVIMGIQVLSIILIIVIGVVKNLDAEKGLRNIFFIMICLGIEMAMLTLYNLIFKYI